MLGQPEFLPWDAEGDEEDVGTAGVDGGDGLAFVVGGVEVAVGGADEARVGELACGVLQGALGDAWAGAEEEDGVGALAEEGEHVGAVDVGGDGEAEESSGEPDAAAVGPDGSGAIEDVAVGLVMAGDVEAMGVDEGEECAAVGVGVFVGVSDVGVDGVQGVVHGAGVDGDAEDVGASGGLEGVGEEFGVALPGEFA